MKCSIINIFVFSLFGSCRDVKALLKIEAEGDHVESGTVNALCEEIL